jgi:arabinosyltransferase C
MVYAAWMRQAIDGRLLFDNRFAVEPQPGLTVHMYFWLLGLIAKVIGIPWAAFLTRIAFTVLFVVLLDRFVRQLALGEFAHRLALVLTVFGGGLGFLVWHDFGLLTVKPGPFNDLLGSRLPNDVWQPEGYVFPSMLTNSLFMVSLCLILGVLHCVLRAKTDTRAVLPGFLCLGALMNVHSYDVLLLALVLVGFLAASVAARTVNGAWIGRALVIGAGALIPAGWFLHVLSQDTVFQARAATETFSPNFRVILAGYGLLMLASLPLLVRANLRQKVGAAVAVVLLSSLAVAAGNHGEGYFLTPIWFAVAYTTGLTAVALMATRSDALNLVMAWAVLGLVVIYFPGLFQRKLTMGLSIPWAILAGMGVALLLQRVPAESRRLAVALPVLLLSATSLRWLIRESGFMQSNLSNTTVHAPILTAEAREIVAALEQEPGRRVVIALPGVAQPSADSNGNPIPDSFGSPYIADLNPVLAGMAGAYAYAGHWSETPDYIARRNEATALLIDGASTADPIEILRESGATHLVQARGGPADGLNWRDLTPFAEPITENDRFRLWRVRR